MKLRNHCIFLISLALGLILLGGCGPKVIPLERPAGKLAVAGFANPRFSWELLAGYLPEEGKTVSGGVLMGLDETVRLTLAKHGVVDYVPPSAVSRCSESLTYEDTGTGRVAALKYWLKVGDCADVDYLLVPQLLYWKERVGGEMTAGNPSSVMLDLYLVDVNNQRIYPGGRYHFDETQAPLSENLLEAGKYVDRGGKWISAQELAAEGIEAGLEELGL